MSTCASSDQTGTHHRHPLGRPRLSGLRWPAAVALVVSGAVHAPVTPEHLDEAPYVGVLFIVLMAACVVLAVGVLLWDSTVVWASSGMTCGLAVIAYVLSRSIALPQIGDDVGNWFEPLGVAAVVAEMAAVAIAIHRAGSSAAAPFPDAL